MELNTLKNILESLLLAADKPMDMRRLESLFEIDEDRPSKDEIRQALQALQEDYQDRGIHLKEVASGYRMQVADANATWVARLWEEKPPKYSRALLETLVLIAYRQPITRGEIEDIRGVSVSSHIVKTLLEREWVRVLGHKDVPGKPAMYGTTREFLDYFDLKSLDELPALSDIKDLDKLHPELALDDEGQAASAETADTDAMATEETKIEAVEVADAVESEAVAEADAADEVELTDDSRDQEMLSESQEEEENGFVAESGHQADATDELGETEDESLEVSSDAGSENESDAEPEAKAG